MDGKPIDIEILESTPKSVKVKLPFLDIPVEMDQQFFQPRMEKGYFRIWKKYNQPVRQKMSYRFIPKTRSF
jgi:hypothetical protein